ncbi:MAG TPA: DUF3168 domain-containing protein [Sphingomicrobium sp.]|nr:DUF3168 domain-containing protein [Sphingomicrobium sp.]
MDMQGALRAQLIADAAVAQLVGQRVHWVDRPQGGELPAVTLQTISAARPRHMQGLQTLRSSRVQCDIWAETYKQAREITEAVVAALEPAHTANGISFRPTGFENERDLMERLAGDTKSIHRTTLDLIVWHSPA